MPHERVPAAAARPSGVKRGKGPAEPRRGPPRSRRGPPGARAGSRWSGETDVERLMRALAPIASNLPVSALVTRALIALSVGEEDHAEEAGHGAQEQDRGPREEV